MDIHLNGCLVRLSVYQANHDKFWWCIWDVETEQNILDCGNVEYATVKDCLQSACELIDKLAGN